MIEPAACVRVRAEGIAVLAQTKPETHHARQFHLVEKSAQAHDQRGREFEDETGHFFCIVPGSSRMKCSRWSFPQAEGAVGDYDYDVRSSRCVVVLCRFSGGDV